MLSLAHRKSGVCDSAGLRLLWPSFSPRQPTSRVAFSRVLRPLSLICAPACCDQILIWREALGLIRCSSPQRSLFANFVHSTHEGSRNVALFPIDRHVEPVWARRADVAHASLTFRADAPRLLECNSSL